MRTSPQQFEMLISYMEQHGDLAKPTNHARGRLETIKRWEELTNLLNSDGSGDAKTTEKWKKVWSDYKNNTKKKAARLHRAASGTGGGPAVFSRLTDLEQRVLNVIGPQVATGLALEEAGLSQVVHVDSNVETTVLITPVMEESELLNQPGPSHVFHPSPPATPLHTLADEYIEGGDDVQPSSVHQPPVAVPEAQPALAGQTTPLRSVRVSPRRLQRGSPRGLRRGTPRGARRRSPRRVIRPAHSEEAAQHFLNADREWREFRMQQHRDNVDLRREQGRIREMELQIQRDWQSVMLRGLDILERYINNNRRDT